MPGRELLEFENAEIIFRNFEGRASRYNAEGKRNFCLITNPADVDAMREDGWNIKETKPRNEEDEIRYYIKVNLNYNSRIQPKVYMIAGNKKTLLTEQTVGELDFAEIQHIDLVVSPYRWDRDGQVGVSGYVSSMYVTIVEDKFASKYNFDEEEALPFD